MPQTAKDVGKLALSHVAGGNVNQYKPFGRNLANCIKCHKKVLYPVTLLFHFSEYILRK